MLSTRSSRGEDCSRNMNEGISGPLRGGSVAKDNYQAPCNAWGTDNYFLSPPGFSGALATALWREESSEDCNDYTSGLAEEVAQAMLREEDVAADDDVLTSGACSKPVWADCKMSSSPTSPQSTLTGFNWESQSNGGSSGVTSPPIPLGAETVDMLYGDLLRMQEEAASHQRRMLPRDRQVIRRPPTRTISGYGRQSHTLIHSQRSERISVIDERSRDVQDGKANVLSLAIERAMFAKQERHQRGKGKKSEAGLLNTGSSAVYSARKDAGAGWRACRGCSEQQRQLPQQNFSLYSRNNGVLGRKEVEGGGLRAVFLGVPESRECGGTGVFLPRRIGSAQQRSSRRKSGVSTVLLPSHIVQALNLNVEGTLFSPHPRDFFYSGHPCYRQQISAGVHSKPEANTALQEIAPNISLPSEWTY